MNKKAGGVARILNFFEERGFYIILFLCIGAIGISGYVLFFEGQEGNQAEVNSGAQIEEITPDDYPINNAPVINETPVEVPDETPIDEPKTAQDGGEKAEPSVKVNNPVPTPKSPFYVRPVPGEIIKQYSGDKLIKDVTMGDWRTHSGVDFLTLDGERVSAVADGTVEDIFFDAMLGYCIRVSHSDGVESLYCNLMKNATVKKGDAVKAGDIIGGVGSSMLSESADKPHLHLEMMKDGQRIDPMTLLPKK